jgi:hypothetical protein
MIGRMHTDYQMKMIGHDTKAKNISKIEPAEHLGQIEQVVLLGSLKRIPGQGCPGDYMVDGWNVSANKPGYTWHMAYLRDEGMRMKKRGGVDRLGGEKSRIEKFKADQVQIACPLALLLPACRAPRRKRTGESASASRSSWVIFRLNMVKYLPQSGKIST